MICRRFPDQAHFPLGSFNLFELVIIAFIAMVPVMKRHSEDAAESAAVGED